MRKTMLCATLMFVVSVLPAFAQFGKNQVIWEKTTWNFYQSAHFDFYLSLDLKQSEVQAHFQDLVAHCEGSYEFLSTSFNHNLKKRPIVIVSRTHSQFEALRISGDPFMPEGVGAYAFPRGSQLLPNTDLLLVVKPDFLPVLNRTIYTHELVHIFQFDMIGSSFLNRAVGSDPIDGWLYEATADFKANQYAPYSRDDIRKLHQRIAAADPKNPQSGFPTLLSLQQGRSNPYSMGAMVFEFLEAKYGTQRVNELIVSIFKTHKQKFVETLEDFSVGEFSNAEAFDRAHRDFWAARYAEDSLKRPQPYQDTASTKGRQIIKAPYPYPLTSPVVSPDGTQVACLTYSSKNGIVLAVAPNLPREDPAYVKQEKRKKWWLFGEKVPAQNIKPLKVLTPQMPPKPYEYIIAQQLDVWPFNGTDIDWWQEPLWVAGVKAAANLVENGRFDTVINALDKVKDAEQIKKLEAEKLRTKQVLYELRHMPNVSKIAFFARKNRDHVLFVVDANSGKTLWEIEVPLDQAFSPKFSPDGKRIYFSAAQNINRNIYVTALDPDLNVSKKQVFMHVTDSGVFNTAPAVSPDEKSLAYVAFVGDYQKLFLLDLASGEKRQLTWGRWNDNSPNWSADGTTLVYTSDEKDGIWNLYTMDLATKTVSQWTDFYGGVFTPQFVSSEKDRVVYSALLEQHQYQSSVYPNFELFDARLKNPLRVYVVEPTSENMQLAFHVEQTVGEQLDVRQVEHPQNLPARWKFYGGNISIGSSVFNGLFAQGAVAVQDLLANHTHQAVYAKYGDFKFYDYTYIDSSRRWIFAGNFNYSKYPLYIWLYNFQGEQPRYPYPDGGQNQYTLTNTWASETSVTLYTEYPFSKWDRVEFGIRPRKRNFYLPYEITPGTALDLPPSDLEYYNFFKNSSGQTNLGLSAAFVHDTVLYSSNTLGPLHGSALRAQVEYGPALNSRSSQYVTASVDARRYQRLSNSTLAAFRIAGMTSSRPNGDFMLLGGSDTLRAYPYFSVAGNQVGYGSAELRVPLPVMFFGAVPLRGVLFGDYAVAKFDHDPFPIRKEWSYGFGLQVYVFLPMNFEWAKTKFAPDTWNFNFRIGLNF